MKDWNCFICKVPMEKVDDIHISHNDVDLPAASGYRCPVCGVEFIDTEHATGELAEAEGMLNGK